MRVVFQYVGKPQGGKKHIKMVENGKYSREECTKIYDKVYKK